MRTTATVTAIAITAALFLSACAPGDTPDTKTQTTEQNQYQGARFGGEPHVFDDGIEVSLSSPTEFTPSQWAVAGTEPERIAFTVTIKNGSDEPFDPSLIYITLSSGIHESTQIFDAEKKLEGPPMTPIRPGKSIEYQAGFGVTDPDDLTARVSLNDLIHDDITFIS